MIAEALIEARERFVRPSSIGPIAACNGRPTMEAALWLERGGEDAPDAAEAAMGTELHKRAQEAVEAWKAGAAWDQAILFATGCAEDDGIDGWSVFCLRFALETVRDLVQKYDIEPDNCLTEQTMPMEFIGFQHRGTADIVLVVPFKLVIVADFKFGWIDQGDCVDHDQTSVYAAAAAEMFHCEEVIVYLIQPRAEKEHRIPPPALYQAAALRGARASAQAAINLARGNNPQLNPCYDACIYCDAVGRCAAAGEWIMETIDALEMLGWPTDPDLAGEVVGCAKIAEKRAEAIKGEAKDRMKAGEAISGWKLGNGRAIRSVANPATAMEKMSREGVNLLELATCGALTIKPGALPPPVYEIISDEITEKVSEPSLVADKRKKAG